MQSLVNIHKNPLGHGLHFRGREGEKTAWRLRRPRQATLAIRVCARDSLDSCRRIQGRGAHHDGNEHAPSIWRRGGILSSGKRTETMAACEPNSALICCHGLPVMMDDYDLDQWMSASTGGLTVVERDLKARSEAGALQSGAGPPGSPILCGYRTEPARRRAACDRGQDADFVGKEVIRAQPDGSDRLSVTRRMRLQTPCFRSYSGEVLKHRYAVGVGSHVTSFSQLLMASNWYVQPENWGDTPSRAEKPVMQNRVWY